MAVDLRQTHFRFGIDELLENTHGWYAAEDVNPAAGAIPLDTPFLLRFTEQEAGATAALNTDAVFQYNKNAAGWVDITTTSSVVKAVASVAFTNGQACTKRLSGTGTFETSGAGCTEDGSSGGAANDIAASGNSETECGLQIISTGVVNNDVIEFRFRSPDWTVTYTITPSYTVVEGQSVTLAGVSDGAATVTVAVTIDRGLAGSPAGIATVTADLTVTLGGVTLAGTSGGVATVSGNIAITRGLAAAPTGTSTTTGALKLNLVLAGTSAGVATVTGALNVLTTQWQDYGSLILLDVAKYGGTVTYFFEGTLKVTGGTGRARLYDITGDAVVVGSTVSTTSATLVRQRSAALTLTGSKEYKAQQGATTGATVTTRGSRIIVEQAA